MGWKEFKKDLVEVRRDLCDSLFHFTKPIPESTEKGVKALSAFDVLRKILDEGGLVGGSGFIKGSHRCVCFTETPITELVSLFRLLKKHGDPRYEPYGIAVKKAWLFGRGGRPVIYQPDDFAPYLSSEFQHLHVKYDLTSADFSWEREWRVKAKSLPIQSADVLVVVPTVKEASDLRDEFKGNWRVVSLDLFDHGE